jgi:hypothetical protein
MGLNSIPDKLNNGIVRWESSMVLAVVLHLLGW